MGVLPSVAEADRCLCFVPRAFFFAQHHSTFHRKHTPLPTET